MQLENILKTIDNCLPVETAMEGDRLGLQIQSGQDEIRKILITLELNKDVVKEATLQNANCIITFHPLIFFPILNINDNDRVGELCTLLIKNSIALISIHTNFDAFSEGTSFVLSKKLGLKRIGFLAPDKYYPDRGMGVIAESNGNLSQEELLQKVIAVCNSPIRYSLNSRTNIIKKIAIIGGSGSIFLNNAIDLGCDAFITADITYHTFHKANGKIMLIDPGHYEMEQFVPQALAELLMNEIKDENLVIITSKILTNPIRYYPETEYFYNKQKSYLIINK